MVWARVTRHLHPRKLISLKRLLMAHGLSGILPLYIVNEFPKSGGTWISEMLASVLHLPFDDNLNPRVARSVLKGHYLRPGGLRNTTIVWRDGRDVMVSLYHHTYFKFEDRPFNHDYVDLMRKTFPFADYEAVSRNLPAFIAQQFEQPMSPMFTWAQFVRRWAKREDVIHTSYEVMRTRPVAELARIVRLLTARDPDAGAVERAVAENSLDSRRATGRPHQHSFVRKGKVGGWRENFTPEARELFDRYAGDCLEILGYERDGP